MRSEKSHIRNPHSPTVGFLLSLTGATSGRSASSLCPSVPFDFSLFLGMDRSKLLFSLSVSRFFFSSFFYLLTALNLWFGVLWRVLFITPKAFFFLFFFIPLTVILYCIYIYIYIYCFFTQPCLINYNVHYEFSDFCFCVSCYRFIYLLKLNIVGDFTKVRFCDFCFCASCLISFYVFSLMLNVAYLNFWFVL